MGEDKISKIPIENIYYLLCYAWDKLDEKDIVDVDSAGVTSLKELFAKVIVSGVNHIKRRGLDRGYIQHHEEGSFIKGKIDFNRSLKRQLFNKAKAVCEFEELSHDILHNQIVKATIKILKKVEGLKTAQKENLGEVEKYFRDVSDIRLTSRDFGSVQLHSNNYFYDFLLKICEIVYHSILPGEEEGDYKFRDFLRQRDKMATLFEEFIRNFYRREKPEYNVRRREIKWDILADNNSNTDIIPLLKTDLLLESKKQNIIVEVKFYEKTLKENRGKGKISPEHLRQLAAYLKNYELDPKSSFEQLKGILLYPEVDDRIDFEGKLWGYQLGIKTVNLCQNWEKIHERLVEIIQ